MFDLLVSFSPLFLGLPVSVLLSVCLSLFSYLIPVHQVTAIGELLKVVEEGLAEYAQATERLETERKKQSAIIQQTKHRENLEAEVRKEGISEYRSIFWCLVLTGSSWMRKCLSVCFQVRKWEEVLQEEQVLTKDLQNQIERKALQDRQEGFEVQKMIATTKSTYM